MIVSLSNCHDRSTHTYFAATTSYRFIIITYLTLWLIFLLKDDEDEEEDEEEERIRIKLTVEEDYDIGHCIRTAVVSESVLWFTGIIDW